MKRILYTAAASEWAYLINRTGNLCKSGVSVTTVAGTVTNCLVIAPDGYTGTIASSYDASTWATAESDGLVCLPSAGYRNGSSLKVPSDLGLYWPATPHPDVNRAYGLYFDGSSIIKANNNNRDAGCSIRLVSDVN